MTAVGALRGETPQVMVHRLDLATLERKKYDEVWSSIPDYGAKSPGLEAIDQFVKIVQPPPHSSIIDIGCGTGVAGLKLRELGHQVSYLDITDAGLLPDVDRRRFIEQPVWKHFGSGRFFEFGYCCDLMEHIPIEFTLLTVHNVLRNCGTVFFQIALTPDEFGHAIGKPLHLTVQEFTWWRDRLALLGRLDVAMDLGGKAIYVVRR